MNGLITIRSYNRENSFMNKNNSMTDINNSGFHALCAANRWYLFFFLEKNWYLNFFRLGLRLEFIGTIVVTTAATFAVIERSDMSPGLAGLSIAYALQLTGTLSWLVRSATEVETQMVSVERVIHYSKLEEVWIFVNIF